MIGEVSETPPLGIELDGLEPLGVGELLIEDPKELEPDDDPAESFDCRAIMGRKDEAPEVEMPGVPPVLGSDMPDWGIGEVAVGGVTRAVGDRMLVGDALGIPKAGRACSHFAWSGSTSMLGCPENMRWRRTANLSGCALWGCACD